MSAIIDFGNINWGPDEAKGDNQLHSYFYKIPDYDKLISGNKRYVIGRKGTGKTAVLENIRLEAISNPVWFSKDLTLREFPISDLRSFANKSMQDKSKYVNIWTFMILVELAKLCCEDEGNKDLDSYVALREFLKQNFPSSIGGFRDTIETLKKTEAKLSVLKGFIERQKTSEEKIVVEVHYSKVIETLKALLKDVKTESIYFLLFDELDEGYQAGDSNKKLLLLALFRSIENLTIFFKSHTKLKFCPILALRSDIFDNLEDNDLNKLDDYVVRLNWQSYDKNGYSLKELLNTRIRASLQVNDSIDPWDYVVKDSDNSIPFKNKSLFKYFTNRTFDRPRDIIKFLKLCSKFHDSGKLQYKTASKAETSYSDWLYRELRDEIQSHLKIWKPCLGVIQKIGKGNLELKELKDGLLKESECLEHFKEKKIDVDDLVEILFDFGIIGNIDSNGRWIFKYKDFDNRFNNSKRIIIHLGLGKKLSLR